MFSEKLLAGRRILVTGGGTGLGKSMAARFLELGAEIHICGRRKGVCDETATELMDRPAEHVRIPYESTTLSGYLFAPPAATGPATAWISSSRMSTP